MIGRFVGGPFDGTEREIVEPPPFTMFLIHPPRENPYVAAQQAPALVCLNAAQYRLAAKPRAGFAYYRSAE